MTNFFSQQGASAVNIDGLNDVTLSSVQNNDVLKYDSSTALWENVDWVSLFNKGFAGTSDVKQDTVIEAVAAKLYLVVEADGAGDIKYIFDAQHATLDCTAVTDTESLGHNKARVELTVGTATAPQVNYITVTHDESGVASLAAATSIPNSSTEFAWCAIVVVPDATTWATTGAYMHQRWTESVSNNGRGLFTNQREKARFLGAAYFSGIGQTLTITSNGGGVDNVIFTSALGKVFQLHRQDFPAFSGTPTIYVPNDSVTPYKTITDLSDLLTDADGDSLSASRFNLVIWGSVNKTTAECKLFVNLPTGSYKSDSAALADADNTAVTTIPANFKTTGFLIARLALRHTTPSSGTWENLSGGTAVIDLRGIAPGFNSSGGGTPQNSFSDAVFELFDNSDATKLLAFQLSGITPATTRTLTVQDRTGTMALRTKVLATKTGDYPMVAADDVILADGSSASVDVTAPAPASGKEFTVKAIDISNTVRVVPNGAETFDGLANYTFVAKYESKTFISDGTNWFVIGINGSVVL